MNFYYNPDSIIVNVVMEIFHVFLPPLGCVGVCPVWKVGGTRPDLSMMMTNI